MLFVLIGYLVISLFTFPKERIFHQVLLSFFLAYASYITIDTKKYNHFIKVSRKPFIILIIITLILSTVVGFYRVQGEIYTKRSEHFRAKQQWHQVIKEIDKGFPSRDPSPVSKVFRFSKR